MAVVPYRVRTADRFQAVDPWFGNTPTEFSIEAYRYAPEGGQPDWRWGKRETFALRSEIDGLERRMPDSLVYLWMKGRVTREALPGLLRDMEAGFQLKKSDYLPLLHYRTRRNLLIIAIISILCGIGYFLGTRPTYPSWDGPIPSRAWLAAPRPPVGTVRRIDDGLPLEGSLDATFQATVPPMLVGPRDLTSRLGWVRAADGHRLVLYSPSSDPAHVGELQAIVWFPDAVGVPPDLLARARQQVPDADAGWILCAGWSAELGMGGVPFSIEMMGYVALGGLVGFLLITPIVWPQLRRRKQQIAWALSRQGGTHAG
jgi:hypothetical protein